MSRLLHEHRVWYKNSKYMAEVETIQYVLKHSIIEFKVQ